MANERNTVHVYCLPGIREKLEWLAKANHRSLSAEIQALIEQAYIAATKKLKG